MSDLASLLQALDELDVVSNSEWISSLNARKLKELEFHDRTRQSSASTSEEQDSFEMLHSNKKFYATVGLSKEFTDDWIAAQARGRVFLDYACGNGKNAIFAAQSGAKLSIGLDISRVSVENGRRCALAAGVGATTRFVQGDCENTRLPDNSVDVVVCSGMLHHLDLSAAFPELRRILKPGGVCLAVEALDYNPIIKLYRLFTPHLRTTWEMAHILSMRDVAFARRFFKVQNVRYWHLFSIAATLLRRTPLMEPCLRFFNLIDTLLLQLDPIDRLAWIFTFELKKV